MQTLYNSDSFVVVSFEVAAEGQPSSAGQPRGGFEIVDKFARKEIFIEGALAETFKQGVQALVAERGGEGGEALQELLDDYIAGFTLLAHHPVLLH